MSSATDFFSAMTERLAHGARHASRGPSFGIPSAPHDCACFSGIQPTGPEAHRQLARRDPPLRRGPGGYGAEAIFCVVDLHSMTVPYEPAELRADSIDTAALLMAAGLDPERCILFLQSHVPEHSELALDPQLRRDDGRARRMTSSSPRPRAATRSPSGLFDYPVLQAADVLLYKRRPRAGGRGPAPAPRADARHRERFNNRFGETFPLPEAAIPRGRRPHLATCRSPTKKMSTSAPSPEGKILVLDEPDVIVRKLKRAVTDSGSRDRAPAPDKPGVSNLLEILLAVTGEPTRRARGRLRGQGLRRAQERGRRGRGRVPAADPRALPRAARRPAASSSAALARGAERAQAIAVPMLAEVKERVGLVPRPVVQPTT